MRILHKIIFLLTILLLTACAQDPWKAEQIKAQAEANKTQIEAEQFALNQETNRRHADELQAIELNERQLEYERQLALEQTKRDAWEIFITIITLVGSAAMVYAILMGTRATVSAYQEATQGIAKAITQAADIRSRLIYLDDGRQFPAIANAHMITDITTGQVTDTNQSTIANPQALSGAIANRHVGIVAKETRRAGKNSDSVPLAQNPPIIEAKFSDVREYFDMVTQARKASADE